MCQSEISAAFGRSVPSKLGRESKMDYYFWGIPDYFQGLDAGVCEAGAADCLQSSAISLTEACVI